MKVKWDDDIPNIWGNKIHVPNHQPVFESEMDKVKQGETFSETWPKYVRIVCLTLSNMNKIGRSNG